jgi:hypothetical protein
MFKQMAPAGVLFLALAVAGPAALAQHALVDCKQGPLTRNYGKSKWLIYSCADERRLVFVAVKGSPAFPYYFTYFPHNGGYRLEGEGIGPKSHSEAAFKEIGALSLREIASLIEQTRAKAAVE